MKVEANYAVIEWDTLTSILEDYLSEEDGFLGCLNEIEEESQELLFSVNVDRVKEEKLSKEKKEYKVQPEVQEYFDKILLGKRGGDYV